MRRRLRLAVTALSVAAGMAVLYAPRESIRPSRPLQGAQITTIASALGLIVLPILAHSLRRSSGRSRRGGRPMSAADETWPIGLGQLADQAGSA